MTPGRQRALQLALDHATACAGALTDALDELRHQAEPAASEQRIAALCERAVRRASFVAPAVAAAQEGTGHA